MLLESLHQHARQCWGIHPLLSCWRRPHLAPPSCQSRWQLLVRHPLGQSCRGQYSGVPRRCQHHRLLTAFSPIQTFQFSYGDTAAFARITSVEYHDAIPTIELQMEIDPLFTGQTAYLMRSRLRGNPPVWTPFEQIEQLQVNPAEPFSYTDFDVVRTALAYSYRLDVPDLCFQRIVSSDTANVSLPSVDDPAAWFPNVIHAGDPELGRFCPYYVSPLSGDYRMQIFTRWGECVFSTDQLNDCWDGTSLRGKPLPQGVYVYKVRCRHANGDQKIYKGTVLLLR